MKRTSADLKWLPPAEEWDFRSVTVKECRVACHWEYERENISCKSILSGAVQGYCPPIYRQAARGLFPKAWTALTTEQRDQVLGTFLPGPVMQVRKLREFFKRMPVNGSDPEILQSYLHHSYVIVPNFRLHGVEAVIKEFERWARKEAKQLPQSLRGQAAVTPFDALKWLAVARLDLARCNARLTIERARECVTQYHKEHPIAATSDVFPIYASDGAWLKAKKNAGVCQARSARNPSYLLGSLA